MLTKFILGIVILFGPVVIKAQEVFEEQGLLGVKGPAGQLMLKAQYTQILTFDNGYILCKDESPGTKEPLHEIAALGKMQLENEYRWKEDSIEYEPFPFHPEWRYGFYPWEGKAKDIVPAVYQSIRPVGFQGLWEMYDGKRYRLWSRTRKKWLRTTSIKPLKSLRRHDPNAGFVYQGENQKYGILYPSGKEATKPVYRDIWIYHDMVLLEEDKGWRFMYPENYRLASNEVFERIYVEEKITGGILFKKGDKYGLLDEYGDPGLFPPVLDGIKELMPYLYAVKKEQKWGVAHSQDDLEEPYVPFIYDSIVAISHWSQYIGVYEGDKMGLIATDTWKIDMPPSVTEVRVPEYSGYLGFLWFKNYGGWGILDRNTLEMLLPSQYSSIQPKPEQGKVGGFGFIVERKGKKGFVSPEYKEVLPTEYDSVEVLDQGRSLWVIKGQRQGKFSLETLKWNWKPKPSQDKE